MYAIGERHEFFWSDPCCSLGISIAMSATSPGLLTTSRSTFPIVDVEDLQQIVADDLVLQLLCLVEYNSKKIIAQEERTATVFLDELEHAVVFANSAQLRYAHD